MKSFRTLALVALLLILAGINWSISQKEKHLATGGIAYLKLRPVDPRSLMQGDYMALRFEIADDIIKALPKPKIESQNWRTRNKVIANDGYVIVSLDKQGVASYKGLLGDHDDKPRANNEIKIQYRIRNGRVKFASNAFFFQEGHAKIYEAAKYGQFRVNNKGGLLLVAMFDGKLNKLEASK